MSLLNNQSRIGKICVGETPITKVCLGDVTVFPLTVDPKWVNNRLFEHTAPTAPIPTKEEMDETIKHYSFNVEVHGSGEGQGDQNNGAESKLGRELLAELFPELDD